MPGHRRLPKSQLMQSTGRDVDLSSEVFTRLNPIALAFSKLTTHRRKAAEHTIPRLLHRIGHGVTDFSPQSVPQSFVTPPRSNLAGIRPFWE